MTSLHFFNRWQIYKKTFNDDTSMKFLSFDRGTDAHLGVIKPFEKPQSS